MFGVVKNLCNFRKANSGKFALRDSSFSAVNTFTARASIGDIVNNVTTEARTDFYAHGFDVATGVVPDASSPYGINAEYVSDTGVVNFAAANDFMARQPVMRNRYREIDYSNFSGAAFNDSQDAYLLNMMISWLQAAISEHNDKNSYKKGILRVKTMVYSDTHGSVDVLGSGDVVQEIQLGPPVNINAINPTDFFGRAYETYFDRNQVITYDAKTREQETFYLIHLLGRDRQNQNHFDLKIPGVDLDELMIDNGRNGSYRFAADSVNWTDHTSMWRWICEYVEVNRLSHQLAACMEMLSFLVFHPAPTSVEANLWRYGQFTVTIPAMRFTRGVLPILLKGEAFMPSATPSDLKSTMLNEPLSAIIDGAIDNVYFWMGQYVTFQQYAHSIQPWYGVFSSAAGLLSSKYDAAQRASMISVVTGHEVTTLFSDFFKVNFIADELAQHLELEDYIPSTDSPINDVRCRVVPMYNTGSLIIGTLVDQCDEIPHLTGLQSIEVNNGKETADGRLTTLMTASMYRLFGWDTTVDVGRRGIDLHTWAASSTCVLDPVSLSATDDGDEPYRMLYVDRRAGRSSAMPTLDVLRAIGKATLVITIPSISYKITGSRIRDAHEVTTKRPITKMPIIKVSAQSVIRVHHLQPAVDKAEIITAKQESDFQRSADNPPPLMVGRTARTEMLTEESAVGAEPVPGAQPQSRPATP